MVARRGCTSLAGRFDSFPRGKNLPVMNEREIVDVNPEPGGSGSQDYPIYNPWVPKDDRQVVIQEVLLRMDEISPAEDINIVEGQLVDGLLDESMTNYILSADIHKIPLVTEKEYPGKLSGETLEDGVFSVPVDYVRMAWCSCPEWARTLYESDLSVSDSMSWKIQALSKFLAPSRMKPSIVQLPSLGGDGRPMFRAAPCKEGRLTFAYVGRAKPEEVRAKVGQGHGFWQSYLWYAAYMVLASMGEPEMASAALQHVLTYQYIPSGKPVGIPDRKSK